MQQDNPDEFDAEDFFNALQPAQAKDAPPEPLEDDKPGRMLAWLAAPREVLTWWDQAEHDASWHDAALSAGVHFGLPVVSPLDAAILLHGQDPDSTSPEDAERITSDDTTPQDFKTLRRVFEATAAADPRNRTLLDWMHLADRSGCKYHRWAGSYVAHRFGILGPQSPASTPEPKQEKLHGHIVLVNVTAQANHYQQHNVHHHHPAPAPEEAPPAPAAPEPAPAPPPESAPVSEPEQQGTRVKPEPAWIDEARKVAKAYMKDRKGKDLHPTLLHVAQHVAEVLRNRKVYGPSGKPLSAAYIKRHALGPVKNSTGDGESTGAGQGKRGKP